MKPFIVTFGLLYLGLLLGWRGYSVWKQTGINPLMVKTTDDVGGFVVRTSKRLCVCIVLAGVIYCVAEDSLYPICFRLRRWKGPCRSAGPVTPCVWRR